MAQQRSIWDDVDALLAEPSAAETTSTQAQTSASVWGDVDALLASPPMVPTRSTISSSHGPGSTTIDVPADLSPVEQDTVFRATAAERQRQALPSLDQIVPPRVPPRRGVPVNANGITTSSRVINPTAPPVEPGNVDLYAQPIVQNPDGTTSTVDSHSYGLDGLEVLLPSVTPDGRHLTSDDEIVGEYLKTGRHLGKFKTPEDATAFAEQLHNDYAAGKYAPKPGRLGSAKTGGMATANPGTMPILDAPGEGVRQIAGALPVLAKAATTPLPLEPPDQRVPRGRYTGLLGKPTPPMQPATKAAISDVLEGGMKVAEPAMAAGAAMAPISAGAAILAAQASGAATQKGVEALGGSPEDARLVANLVETAVGAYAGKKVHEGIGKAGAAARAAAASGELPVAGELGGETRPAGPVNVGAGRTAAAAERPPAGAYEPVRDAQGGIVGVRPSAPSTDVWTQVDQVLATSPGGPPPAPVDEAGRPLGGYAGPERRAADQGPPQGTDERRLLPRDQVLRDTRNPEIVRQAGEMKAKADAAATTSAPETPGRNLPETAAPTVPETVAETDAPEPPPDPKRIYANIKETPHPYYDLQNQKGQSPFPPGRPPEFYDPFIEHFDERAQTAKAQADRMRKKPLNGSLKEGQKAAAEWDQVAARWREASRVATMRKRAAMRDDVAVKSVTYFRSGATRPADLEGFLAAGSPVGVTATELSKPVEDRIVENNGAVPVFVDSGAFSGDVDHAKTLETYARLANRLTKAGRDNLHVVAPDVVGKQADSLALQKQHAAAIEQLLDQGVKVILPVQKGARTLEDAALDVVRDVAPAPRYRQNIVFGIPSNKAAYSPEEIVEAVKTLAPQLHPGGLNIHLLGMGDRNRAFDGLVKAIHAAAGDYTVRISSDSNRVAAIFGAGRPAQTDLDTKVEQRAEAGIDDRPSQDTTELTGHLWGGQFDQFSKPELERVAKAVGIPVEGLYRRAGNKTLRKLLDTYEMSVEAALHEIARERGRKDARPGARAETITEHEKGRLPVVPKGERTYIVVGKGKTAVQYSIDANGHVQAWRAVGKSGKRWASEFTLDPVKSFYPREVLAEMERRGIPIPEGQKPGSQKEITSTPSAGEPAVGARVRTKDGKEGIVREVFTAGKAGGKGDHRLRRRARVLFETTAKEAARKAHRADTGDPIAPNVGDKYEQNHDLDRLTTIEEPPHESPEPVRPPETGERAHEPGPEPEGGGDEGAGGGGDPDEPIADDPVPTADETVDTLVKQAVDAGWKGDAAALRAELQSRLALVEELDGQLADAGRSPLVLLKAIRDLGGISIRRETGWKGELRWLAEGGDGAIGSTRKASFGRVNGIAGVFNRYGKTFDDMLQSLQADGRFNHIEDLNDLFEEIRAASSAGREDALVDRFVKGLGPDWWTRLPEHLNPEPVEDVAPPDADADISFDPEELEGDRKAQLEAMATDEAMGVTFDKHGQSTLPDGGDAINCTNCAARMIELAGNGDIFGWEEGENPTSIVAGPTHGARLDRGQGHDFAVIDGRYLVDAWAKNVESSAPRAVFDLDDPADVAEVRRLYGDPETWVRYRKLQGGHHEWVKDRPAQLQAPAAAVDKLDTGEEQPRLPVADKARQVGRADTTFKAPVQASGEDFSLSDGQEEPDKQEPLFMPKGARPPVAAVGPGEKFALPKQRPLPVPRTKTALEKLGLRSKRKALPVREIQQKLTDLFRVPVGTRHFPQRALGIYKPDVSVVRLGTEEDLQVLGHEMGHHLDMAIMEGSSIFNRGPISKELQRVGAPTSLPSYDAKQKRQEGTAEFFRRWLTEPETLTSEAPLFSAAFQQFLDHADPKLVNGLYDIQEEIQRYLAQTPEQQARLHIDFKGGSGSVLATAKKIAAAAKTPEERARTMAYLSSQWMDDLAFIKLAEQSLHNAEPVDVGRSAYVQARLARGYAAKAEGFLEHGVRDYDGQFLGRSLDDVLAPVYDRLEDFALYAAARRAADLHKRGKASGFTTPQLQAVLDKYAKDEPFAKALDGLREFHKAKRQYLVASGIISQEAAHKMNKVEPNYVPFERVRDVVGGHLGGRKIANRASPIKRMKGSGRRIVNPLETIIKNTHAEVNAAETNLAMRKLVRTLSGPGSAEWIEEIPEPQVMTRFNLQKLEKDIRALLEDLGVEELPDGGTTLDEYLDTMVKVFTPRTFARGNERFVTVLDGGTLRWFEVHDDGLYDALTSIGPQGTEQVVRMFFRGARALKTFATSTLGFIIRNPIKDQFAATIQSRAGYRPTDFLRGLAEYLRAGEKFQLYLSSGADQANLVADDRDLLRKRLKQLGHGKLRKFVDDTVLNPLDGLRVLSAAGETATRLGEFMRTLDNEGEINHRSLQLAAINARDVTQDFQKAGRQVRAWNQYTAFFSARVGGYGRMWEAAKENPSGFLWKSLVAIALPSLLLWVLNHDDPEYNEIPAWERNYYWHVPFYLLDKDFDLGTLTASPKSVVRQHGWLKIPKPFELGQIFGTALEVFLDYLKGTDPNVASRLMDKTTAYQTAQQAIPTAVLPFVEVAANYDFFRDRAIVNPWQQDLAPELQYSRWTSETAKRLGELLEMSPSKIETIIYGYTAGFGQGVLMGADPFMGGRKPSGGPGHWPGVGAIWRDKATSEAQSLQDLYTTKALLEGLTASVKEWRAMGKEGRAQQAIAGAQKLAPYEQSVKRADAELKKWRTAVNTVFDNPQLSPGEKREALDQLYLQMLNIARTALGRKPLDRGR